VKDRETTSEEIRRGAWLLKRYVEDQQPHHSGGTYGLAITCAIRDLLALAENHGWRFDVEANLMDKVMHHAADLACKHKSTDVTETSPEDPSGRTSAYLVCADCGAEFDEPWAGSGVL
jgi:hypothetical protein